MPTTSSVKPKYRRIVLKISGEALRNDETGQSIDSAVLDRLAEELKSIRSLGAQVAVVVGGCNKQNKSDIKCLGHSMHVAEIVLDRA